MNLNESGGGSSSSKGQENGVVSTAPERPLKKARFAWQVKGKYHLKNENTEDNKPNVASSDVDRSNISSDSDSDTPLRPNTIEQTMKILCEDSSNEWDLSDTENLAVPSDEEYVKIPSKCEMENFDTGLPGFEFKCPYLLSSNSNSNPNVTTISSLPLTIFLQPKMAEDICMATWQSRQMAQIMVDNTINRVLDSWKSNPPVPIQRDGDDAPIDIGELIHISGMYNVENQGILMAISAHGLQSPPDASWFSRLQFERDIDERKRRYEARHKERKKALKLSLGSNNMGKNDHKDDDDDDYGSLPSLCDSETSSGLSSPVSEKEDNSLTDCDENISANDHSDFLDTAVSFAIQNKGLTSYSDDCG